MIKEQLADDFSGLRKGLLPFAVLKVVAHHKVYVANILEKLGSTELKTSEGTLYPLLSRMRREQLLEYEWVESESGPPRKYYQLTDEGIEQLSAYEQYWKLLHKTMSTLGESHE